jgi:hypothetical protein
VFLFKKKKIFFSRTSQPISIKFCANHPWVKGYQVYSNKGTSPLQGGDNYKTVKTGSLQIFFSRTT